ncbi:putative D-xylose utilization operon transcriptional repressor [bioreactor metagenome]|uniref:Putative D-xylose utilization operon transcriptional repressor n=1 Tax=bioreactor metagenome TaxID=1076179 RepID=A0A644UHI5_9ZZZZ|nr:GntR family transcriptional regulator [Acidaminococcaceae bacterium]
MNNLGKIKILPVREHVAGVLRKAILIGELQEGQEITLKDIASQVGVSSMPVREAFQMLALEGLIKLRPNKGAVVLEINEKTIRDHYETRALLEGEAAALASKNSVDISEIEGIQELAEEALAANNYNEYNKHNQAFHVAIWAAADNAKIANILASLWNGMSMGPRITKEDYAILSNKEHRKIATAIKKHDADQARDAMHKHITRSMEDILKRYNNR